jgi:hypothetical protein
MLEDDSTGSSLTTSCSVSSSSKQSSKTSWELINFFNRLERVVDFKALFEIYFAPEESIVCELLSKARLIVMLKIYLLATADPTRATNRIIGATMTL